MNEARMNQAAEVRAMDLLHMHAREMATLLRGLIDSDDDRTSSYIDGADRKLIEDLLRRAGVAS